MSFSFNVLSYEKEPSKGGLKVCGVLSRGELTVGDHISFCDSSVFADGYVRRIEVKSRNVQSCTKGINITIYIAVRIPINTLLLRLASAKNIVIIPFLDLTSINTPQKNAEPEINTKHTRTSLVNKNAGDKLAKEKKINIQEKEFVKNLKIATSLEGYLSPSESFLLEKIRKSLKIDLNIARKLSNDYISKIPKDEAEREYYEAVAVCLLDRNYVSDNERKLLMNLRVYLHISEARAAEIEKLADWEV